MQIRPFASALARGIAVIVTLSCMAGWTTRVPDLRDSARGANHQYEQLVIILPTHQTTVFDNAGHVDVKLLMSPALALAEGDTIELFFDGAPAATARKTATGFVLEKIERGSHQLQARIVNQAGQTVIASEPVTFFMWQASRQFPNRRQ